MSTQTATARVITLYATKGAKKAKLETEATTWGELKSLIKREGYDLDKLHATENINKTDLVNDAAVLPTGDFTVFMRPKQVKSGGRGDGLSYKEIKSAIKDDFTSFKEEADAHYNQEKNYTTKGTEILRGLLNTFVAPSGVAKAEVKEEVAPVVTETATVIETPSAPVRTITNADRVEQVETLLKEICDNTENEDVSDRANEILDDYLPGLKEEVENDDTATVTTVADVVASVAASKDESPEDEGRRIAREKAQKEEEEKLAAEKKEKEEKARLEKEEDDRLAAEAKMFG
ncbi:hypothetical protein [Flavobacterium phage FpV4]|uniref:Uncharacterized protein n=2 Tax=Fipvunavirus Fpv4 TaxID=2560476 RepID=A0A1B0WKU8_9CAUD|nr:hypothetical protein BOW80_gp55 [Flavobacterium phage Fpv3]YP_009594109.1 hypothetical protein FDG89_gp53 [Flavobacterium phage FpV4]ALN97166.1 hypothetical protein [Flavobacterium phage FpV4]ANB40457.1 hypothetical protein [Flavobacterium phage Fpv3]